MAKERRVASRCVQDGDTSRCVQDRDTSISLHVSVGAGHDPRSGASPTFPAYFPFVGPFADAKSALCLLFQSVTHLLCDHSS